MLLVNIIWLADAIKNIIFSGGLPTLGQRWPSGQKAVGPMSAVYVGPTDVLTLGKRRSDGGMLSGYVQSRWSSPIIYQ